MKKIFIFTLSFFVISGLLISFNGWAQEDVDVVADEEESEEVLADEDITAEDLGISEPKLLPDSPFYFIKDFWRKVKVKLTFNSVKKAELQLEIANERLIEFKKLAEITGNEQMLQKALAKYQSEMEIVENRIETFKEKAADNPKIDKFLDKFTNKTLKQQRLMDRLEKNLADKPEVLEKIRENKERALEHFGEVMSRLEEKDKIPERLEKNLENIEGSKYKNFKNLEILLELENKVPEQAKEAIQQAQENSLKRLHGNLEQMSPEDQEKFKDYLDNVSGDQTTHLKILERLNEKELLPVLKEKVEQNRERIQERVEAIKEDAEQLRERIQERIQQQEVPEQTQEQNQEQVQERACVTIWDPVCGEDGKTYSNACFAKLSEVKIAYTGECREKEEIPQITSTELERGWYWGNRNQYKPGTPSDWLYEEAGRSSCWHKKGIRCGS